MIVKPTENQLEAVNYDGRMLAITAGAGSGKTRVLIWRICRLLDEKKTTLNEILAVTFTEKAAAELKERLAEVVTDDAALAAAYIGTIHSFCARILREHAPLAGLDPDFGVMEEHAAGILARRTIKDTLLRLLKERRPDAELLIEELGWKNALLCMEELIQHRWHTHRIKPQNQESGGGDRSFDAGHSIRLKEERLRNAALYCFNEVEKTYSSAKSPDLDFADLEINAIRLLENKEIRLRYARRFRHIFVDEFQDTNDTQARLISLLHEPGKNSLTVVGDKKQSIYRFRGANHREFEKAAAGAEKVVRLDENFRSAGHIISFVNGVFPDFEPLATSKGDLPPSVFKLEINLPEKTSLDERRGKEAETIADIVPSLVGETACLFSSLGSLDLYEEALRKKGLHYTVYGGHGFLERQDIIDVMNFLKVVNNSLDPAPLLGIARSPKIGLTDDEIYLMCADRNKEGEQDISKLFIKIRDCEKSHFLRELLKIAPLLSISEMIRFIGGSGENIEKLADIAESIEEGEETTLAGFIEYIESLRGRKNKIADFPSDAESGLFLMTIHQAKGLEFKNVILADTIRRDPNNTSRWIFIRGENPDIAFKVTPEENPESEPVESPLFGRLKEEDAEEDEAERLRLLYVAMTRAKEKLIMPLHPGAKRDGSWHKMLLEKCKSVEAFKCLSQTAGHSNTQTLKRLSTPPSSSTQTLKHLNTLFTPTMLEDYAACPHMYCMKYILGVPEGTLKDREGAGLPANIHGDIVHKKIEYHAKGADAAIEEIALEMGIESGRITPSDKEAVEKTFRCWLDSRYSRMASARHEMPFFMNLGGDYYIDGKIDMLVPEDDSWEVVDFKTGNIGCTKDEVKRKYDIQIKTYSLAAAKKLGRYSGRATLLLLSGQEPETVSLEITERDLLIIEERLVQMMRDISNSRFDTASEQMCGRCPYCGNETCWRRYGRQ